MVVNNIKTKVMVFGKPTLINLTLNGAPLEIVNSYKSLGVMINPIRSLNGNIYQNHPDYLCKQARKAAFNIFNKIKSIGDIPAKHLLYLYQSMIQPVLIYGSELWGFMKNANKTLDTMFMWFARTILKVKSSTSNLITLGECGILSPSVLCHINVILYAIRLNSVINDDILKCVFDKNVEFHNMGYATWYSKVLSLAKSYDINIENMVYSNCTKLLIKEKIRNSFIETWFKDINNSVYSTSNMYETNCLIFYQTCETKFIT